MFKRIFKKLKKNIPKVEKNRKKKVGEGYFYTIVHGDPYYRFSDRSYGVSEP